MTALMTTLPLDSTKFEPRPNKALADESLELPGAPVIADEDQLEQKKNKKENNKKNKKENKKEKKKSKKDESSEKTKPIRQAIGVIVIDPDTQKVLLLESKKRPGAYVLPRDDCLPEEHPEKAAIRLLAEKAGIQTTFLSCRVGSFSETNKKGKITDQHWMYEVRSYGLLEPSRARSWFTYREALEALKEKKISHLALQKCSLSTQQTV